MRGRILIGSVCVDNQRCGRIPTCTGGFRSKRQYNRTGGVRIRCGFAVVQRIGRFSGIEQRVTIANEKNIIRQHIIGIGRGCNFMDTIYIGIFIAICRPSHTLIEVFVCY